MRPNLGIQQPILKTQVWKSTNRSNFWSSAILSAASDPLSPLARSAMAWVSALWSAFNFLIEFWKAVWSLDDFSLTNASSN